MWWRSSRHHIQLNYSRSTIICISRQPKINGLDVVIAEVFDNVPGQYASFWADWYIHPCRRTPRTSSQSLMGGQDSKRENFS